METIKTTTTTLTTNTVNVTLQQFILQQQVVKTNTSNYVNFTSKKLLLQSNMLTQTQKTLITTLHNCFTFLIHKNLTHIIVTMYYSKTKSYSFLYVNLTNYNVVQFNTIKLCKQYITTLK